MVTSKSVFAACLGMLLVSSLDLTAARPKQSDGGLVHDIVNILRKNNHRQFCKAYLEVDVGPIMTKTVTVTNVCDRNVNARCAPTTTVTTTVGVTQTLTNTVTAETPTVTTEVVVTETTTTTTTNPTTITSTIGTPFTVSTPESAPQRRGALPLGLRPEPKLPAILKKYSRAQIKAACSILLNLQINVITYTTTTVTIPPPATRTVTPTVATTTVTATITPDPKTLTRTTSTTTVTETETAPPTTVTVCPYTRTDITSYAGDGQTLRITSDTTEVECCARCWNTPGCTGWGFFIDREFCANISPSPDTETCPNGGGEVGFRTRGFVENRISAGTGPCFSGWRDVTI